MSKEQLRHLVDQTKLTYNSLLEITARHFNAQRFNFHNVQILYNLPERILPLAKWFLHEVNSQLSYGRSNMPMTIGIETISVCNRHCSYCTLPLPEFAHSRNPRVMSDEVFSRTIQELESWPRTGQKRGFNGALFLNVYGEPLLDSKIVERVQWAVQALPDAKVGLFSNGDYLTEDLLTALISAGISEVVLTPHDGEFKPEIYMLAKKYSPILRLKQPLAYLCNRGGKVEVDQSNLIYPKYRCVSPAYAFHVACDGTVGMCFNDSTLSHPVGKVQDSPLLEIWDNPEYRRLRSSLKHGRWDQLPAVCASCRTGKT